MRWYDDPLLLFGWLLLGLSVVFAAVVGICLILALYSRIRQNYHYNRLPIYWGERLVTERTRDEVVVDLDVAELQNEIIDHIRERAWLTEQLELAHSALEASDTRLVRAERARKRHLATVRRLQREGYGTRVPSRVPELWTLDNGTWRGSEIRS